MAFDWILRGCRLPGRDGAWDVGIGGSRVTAVLPRLAEVDQRELSVADALVLPGFHNAYARLDGPPDDLEGQSVLVFETAVRHGTTAMRVSVDTDPDEPLMPLRRLARVRAQLTGGLDIALGLRLDGATLGRARGLAALMESAKHAGANALEISNEAVADLVPLLERAAGAELAVDLAVDVALPPGRVSLDALALPRVLTALESLSVPPPIRLLHATALAAVHRDDLAPALARLHALGVPIVVCPLEALRREGRQDPAAARRGLPRLRELLAAGVAVQLGSGSALDAAALDPLAAVWLAAYAGYAGTPAALEKMQGLIAPGLVEPGTVADLVVLDAPSFARGVIDHAERRSVFKAGRLVHRAERKSSGPDATVPSSRRLVIRGATLPRRPGRHDIVAIDGVIREIAPRADHLGADDGEIAADGRLVTPAFVDAHLHVDKTFVMDGLALGQANLTVAEAVAAMRAVKARYTPDDLRARGRLTLERALRHGTTAIRAQCDIDPVIGLMALEALAALRREFADRLDLQIVAFPQEGLVDNPAAIPLMREALKMGADVVGGGPLDADHRRHIAQVFALAQEFGAPVDIHADLAIDNLRPLAEWEAPLVAERARQAGLRGRVAIGHFAASSALTRDELRPLADTLAEAGIAVAALTASELYRQGLNDPVGSRRGMPRVRDLLEFGVNVVFASNNLRDAFVTFGNADMLEQALLGATVAHLDDMETALEMVTTRAATLMGLTGRSRVEVGQQADLVLLDARSVAEAVGDQAEKLAVIHHGRIVARNRIESETMLSGPGGHR